MCGIAGIIMRPGAGKETIHSSILQRLQKMTNAIQHRGPEGEGFWVSADGAAGLGHRRLCIIDLSDLAAQPMHLQPFPAETGEARYSIVHNGEIYNYKELRAELQKEGYHFRTRSDTEVILAAYDFWKEECVDEFDGMFAFAIWDDLKKELFAARDRCGEKPFFYHFNKEEFVFGSEIKALWAAGIERKPNLQMLFNYLTIAYTGNPENPKETFFEHVQKLPPATFLKYKAATHELVLEKYWDIDPEEQNKAIQDGEALGAFTSLLTASVNRRLRSDVTLGSSLSGGLDSSAVVCLINKLNADAENIRSGSGPDRGRMAFTAIFPGFKKDESAYSKQVADRFGIEQQTVAVTVEDLLKDWERFCHHQEEPVGSASAYAQFKVFELARTHGVKVLLDGQGADESLAGYHKYYKWYWQELFHRRKLLASGELKAASVNGVVEKFGFRNVIASVFPDLASVVLERQYLLHALRQEDLNKEFVRLQSKEAYYTTPSYFSLNGALYFNSFVNGLEELLRYADRNSMAHGREVRLPFLNHELLEFVFSLPSHFKIRKGWTKWLLRKSMETSLPEEINWRKEKVGFEPPQESWMQNSHLQEMIHESRKKLVNERILKPEVMQKPVRVLESNAAENYDWRYLSAAGTLF